MPVHTGHICHWAVGIRCRACARWHHSTAALLYGRRPSLLLLLCVSTRRTARSCTGSRVAHYANSILSVHVQVAAVSGCACITESGRQFGVGGGLLLLRLSIRLSGRIIGIRWHDSTADRYAPYSSTLVNDGSRVVSVTAATTPTQLTETLQHAASAVLPEQMVV